MILTGLHDDMGTSDPLRRKFFIDVSGRYSVQPLRQFKPRGESKMGNPVVYFEIVGHDAKALQDFYRQAFGWQIGPPIASGGPKDYAMVFPKAEGCINGGIGGGIGDHAGHATFYVEVPDIKSALRKVETRGGKRIMGPESIPNGPTIALFNDPEGPSHRPRAKRRRT